MFIFFRVGVPTLILFVGLLLLFGHPILFIFAIPALLALLAVFFAYHFLKWLPKVRLRLSRPVRETLAFVACFLVVVWGGFLVAYNFG